MRDNRRGSKRTKQKNETKQKPNKTAKATTCKAKQCTAKQCTAKQHIAKQINAKQRESKHNQSTARPNPTTLPPHNTIPHRSRNTYPHAAWGEQKPTGGGPESINGNSNFLFQKPNFPQSTIRLPTNNQRQITISDTPMANGPANFYYPIRSLYGVAFWGITNGIFNHNAL